MARDTRTDSYSGDGGNGSAISSALKDRIILALFAAVVGSGGAASYMGIKNPRPDPWTGSEARQAHNQIREYLHQEIRALRAEIKSVDAKLQQHLVRGEAGFYRIDRLERDVKDLKRD